MRFDQNIRIKMTSLYAARHEPEAYTLLARAYWAVMVVVVAVLMVGGIAYGVWEFLKPLPEATSGVKPQLNLSKAQLEKILKGFQTRSDNYEKSRVAPTVVRDPS